MSNTHQIHSLEELNQLTKVIIPNLPKGEIIGLVGELGAGKTTFVQSVCSNLLVSEPVVSPTYSIENRYTSPNGIIIHHLDLFRLNPEADLEFILELIGGQNRLIFIEWPDRVLQVLEKVHTFITIAVSKNGSRTIEIYR